MAGHSQLTDIQEGYDFGKEISRLSFGSQVTVIHSRTDGLSWDTTEVVGLKCTGHNEAVKIWTEELTRAIEHRKKVGGNIHVVAASRGAEEAYHGLLRQDPAFLATRMRVTTIGGARIIHPAAFAQATNLINNRDWVPCMANPINYACACMNPEEWGVKFLDSPHGPFSFDHSALGDTYKTELKKISLNFHSDNAGF